MRRSWPPFAAAVHLCGGCALLAGYPTADEDRDGGRELGAEASTRIDGAFDVVGMPQDARVDGARDGTADGTPDAVAEVAPIDTRQRDAVVDASADLLVGEGLVGQCTPATEDVDCVCKVGGTEIFGTCQGVGDSTYCQYPLPLTCNSNKDCQPFGSSTYVCCALPTNKICTSAMLCP